MPIQSIIIDPTDGRSPEVDAAAGERQGLVVATRPLKAYRHKLEFFTNATYGADMNKNVTFAGTPVAVYTDNAPEWTWTAVAGTWDFDQTAIKQAGTKAIDATATINNSTAQAAQGSELTVASYTALTGYIYITGWANASKGCGVRGWDADTGLPVGVEVDIGKYINITTFGAWQQFVIPLSAFAFTAATIDALRFRTISLGSGGAPDYYLDTIRFEETGAPIIYRVKPDIGTWFHVNQIRITMADNWVSTLADATLPEIPYDTLLGVAAITSGLLFQRIQGGEVESSFPARQVSDWFQMPGTTMDVAIGDASNTLIAIEVPYQVPEILKFEAADEMRVTVQDNLSGLLMLRMVAGGFEEAR